MGEMRIVAEELIEDAVITGSTASVQLKEVSGETLTGRDLTDIYARYGDFVLVSQCCGGV